jgi:hypothetical protein
MSTTKSIIQGGARVYYANSAGNMVEIGELHPDGIDSSITQAISGIGTARTGQGEVAHFTGGTSGEFTLKLINISKYLIDTVFQTFTSTGLNSLDGTSGSMTFGSDAGRRLQARRLVIYPTGTNENGVQFLEDSTNPLGVEIYKALCISDFSTSFKPDEPNSIELTFKPQIDLTKTNNNKMGKIGGVTL